MADQERVRDLLRGAFDTHIHSAPDVLPRKFDDIDLAKRALDAGMAGFVLKSHYICTADRATLLNKLHPGIQAFGAIALNNSVGGLNPLAVDIAGRLGNKVVWFPTVDSANELENVAGQKDESKLPYWMSIARELRAQGIAGSWLQVLNEDGSITADARQCLEVIGNHDMVLATGHISPAAMLPVVKAAREAKVQRIIVTHPEFPTTLLSIDQQKELSQYGVFFERCYTTPASGKIPWEAVFANVRGVGPASTILATDLGQTTNPYADEGLGMFIDRFLDAGFGDAELRQMVQANPRQVLGAK
ncbi:MAG: DUF6282 family protein [Dehalococcoidia bacterium]